MSERAVAPVCWICNGPFTKDLPRCIDPECQDADWDLYAHHIDVCHNSHVDIGYHNRECFERGDVT